MTRVVVLIDCSLSGLVGYDFFAPLFLCELQTRKDAGETKLDLAAEVNFTAAPVEVLSHRHGIVIPFL